MAFMLITMLSATVWSAEGKTYRVTGIGTSAFNNCSGLTGDLTAELRGANKDSFIATATNINSLGVGEKHSFTVKTPMIEK